MAQSADVMVENFNQQFLSLVSQLVFEKLYFVNSIWLDKEVQNEIKKREIQNKIIKSVEIL